MLRGLASILIGAVLALLLAGAAQFIFAPFVGTRGLPILRIVDLVVFWGVFALVVVAVVRGPRA